MKQQTQISSLQHIYTLPSASFYFLEVSMVSEQIFSPLVVGSLYIYIYFSLIFRSFFFSIYFKHLWISRGDLSVVSVMKPAHVRQLGGAGPGGRRGSKP